MDWISVKDRLPEIEDHHCSKEVIVLFNDGSMGLSALGEIDFGIKCFACELLLPKTVTHWMLLPEPPKEET